MLGINRGNEIYSVFENISLFSYGLYVGEGKFNI